MFNEIFAQMELLGHIKFHYFPCFYDNIHLCFGYTYDSKRLDKYFEFIHNKTFCLGQKRVKNSRSIYVNNVFSVSINNNVNSLQVNLVYSLFWQ